MVKLGEFFFGKQPKLKQLQDFTPQQQQLINQAAQMAQQGNEQAFKWLQSILGDEEGAFEDFERPFMEQFQEQTIPSILERFAGTGMSKGSSGLNQSLGQAGRKLSGDIATLRAGLKGNAINQLNQYSQTGLTKQTSPYIKQGSPGVLGQAGAALGQGFGDIFSNYRPSGSGFNLLNYLPGGV